MKLRSRFSSSTTASSVGFRKRTLFIVVFILLVGLSVELLLNLLRIAAPPIGRTLGSRWVTTAAPHVDDPMLNHRPNPDHPDHDERGFRNAVATRQADIVCLGDSQTYGTGVARDEAWPRQLGELTGQGVYNMAFGGWGPTHSEVLLDDAIQLRPKLVIEAFYGGNDLYDCYEMVYKRDRLQHYRSGDVRTKAQIVEANEQDPLEVKFAALFRIYCGQFDGSREMREPIASQRGLKANLRQTLSNYSHIYGLGRAVKNQLLNDTGATVSFEEDSWKKLCRTASKSQGMWEVLESPPIYTVFVPEYRLAALNMEDPRIREGHRISKDAIANMHKEATSNRIEFLVVLIPTKPLVFAPRVDTPSSAFNQLVKNETQMWANTKAFLEESEISFVDTLPALRDAVENGTQPYKLSADGHPNAAGHRAIADAVFRWLNR